MCLLGQLMKGFFAFVSENFVKLLLSLLLPLLITFVHHLQVHPAAGIILHYFRKWNFREFGSILLPGVTGMPWFLVYVEENLLLEGKNAKVW